MFLVCIDTSNLLVRHNANPYGQSTDDLGRPTHGAVGALSQIWRLVREHQPTHLLLARDSPRDESFRRDLDPAYKAHRADKDEDLTRQFKLAYEAAEVLRWPVISVDKHEADDVIASAATAFTGRTLVFSADKDLLALCSDRVEIFMPRPGGPERVGPAGCRKIIGVEPRQVRDYKALVGDPSDGICGIDGIGPKTAVKLLETYGSLKTMYAHMDKGGEITCVPPKMVAKLTSGREDARRSFKLASLIVDLPIDFETLRCPDLPQWDTVAPQLTELGLAGIESSATGKKAKKGPADLDRAFRQLQF